jgi:hypothetical protein
VLDELQQAHALLETNMQRWLELEERQQKFLLAKPAASNKN